MPNLPEPLENNIASYAKITTFFVITNTLEEGQIYFCTTGYQWVFAGKEPVEQKRLFNPECTLQKISFDKNFNPSAYFKENDKLPADTPIQFVIYFDADNSLKSEQWLADQHRAIDAIAATQLDKLPTIEVHVSGPDLFFDVSGSDIKQYFRVKEDNWNAENDLQLLLGECNSSRPLTDKESENLEKYKEKKDSYNKPPSASLIMQIICHPTFTKISLAIVICASIALLTVGSLGMAGIIAGLGATTALYFTIGGGAMLKLGGGLALLSFFSRQQPPTSESTTPIPSNQPR